MTRFSSRISAEPQQKLRVLGLMSGTSMDGMDVALLETDGEAVVKPLGFASTPYPAAFRAKLRAALGLRRNPRALAEDLTRRHAAAVKAFLKKYKVRADSIDLIGFHGHTLSHAPDEGHTLQIGDGKLLAKLTSIPVAYDFRSEDVRAGGQGAPLVPVYHRAMAAKWPKPCLIVNIGGVANATYVDAQGGLLAFDCGPGNALLDDWLLRHTGQPLDEDGKLARRGMADAKFVARFLRHAFFRRPPPKSLDRDAFTAFVPNHLSPADGAATLTLMTALGIAAGLLHLPETPKAVVLCGGGRYNKTLVKLLRQAVPCPVKTVDALGFKGDATEAEAFAYLAMRAVKGLPLSYPTTTGRQL